MGYLETLRAAAEKSGSIACMGLDPVMEKIPISGSIEKRLKDFYIGILEALAKNGIAPASVKPNIAFFEQYGLEGLTALREIIKAYKDRGLPVILDCKRGDIGKTSQAYAKAIFEYYGADATTVSPYMGSDSVGPFIDFCERGKGVYILVRTSNKGAEDLQSIKDDSGTPLFLKTAEKLLTWHKDGTGAVVGATSPSELKTVSAFFASSGKKVPLLIPGVGSQGGSAKDVMSILSDTGADLKIHRINSSSEINYAFEKRKMKDFAACAADALADLIEKTKVK